jgi:Flp pilus assembly protein TadD
MQRAFSRLAVSVALSFAGAAAQDFGAPTLKGEVQTGLAVVARSTAELDDLRTHHKVATSEVRADGVFEFREVPNGSYRLAFTDLGGETLYETFVTVDGLGTSLSVRIPEPRVDRPPSGGVSAQQLMHPPDRKALQAMVSAQKRSSAGDYSGAAEELERAVRISPTYADAYNNLAAQHIRLGQYEKALTEIGRATEIAGPTALGLCNEGMAELALGREKDAMSSVRRSLELDPRSAPAHYLLGNLLARDRRTLKEAAAHLELAAQKFASARAALDSVRNQIVNESAMK